MAAYRRRNMLAGIRGIQGRDRPSRGLSAPLWSRYADRAGENRVKSLRSKRANTRVLNGGRGGHPPSARPRGRGFSSLIQINDGGDAPWQASACQSGGCLPVSTRLVRNPVLTNLKPHPPRAGLSLCAERHRALDRRGRPGSARWCRGGAGIPGKPPTCTTPAPRPVERPFVCPTLARPYLQRKISRRFSSKILKDLVPAAGIEPATS